MEATLWAAYTKLKERLEAEKRSAAILQEQCLEMRAQQGQALLVRVLHSDQELFRVWVWLVTSVQGEGSWVLRQQLQAVALL